jgi:hypothetical protein
MIKVKHPVPECNIAQEKYLASCPQEHRRFHELFYTYGNITYRYHNDAQRLAPTEEDYKEWLQGLPDNLREAMKTAGFEECKRMLPFTRYVMEKNDIGIDEYVQLHMDQEDYLEYKSMINPDRNKSTI